MKIDIERIKVDETTRIRQDIGDLASLEESIQQVGLINPVLIDENDALVAGFRRLSACRNLGWKEIEVTVVQLEGDELKMLEAEVAENLFRKEFTPDEILAIQKRRDDIAEARRPKGAFERFWNWIKALFQSDLADKPTPQQPAPASPTQEAPQDPPEESAADAEAEPEEQQTEPEPEPEPEPEQDSEQGVDAAEVPTESRQPKAAEIVEKNGVRHIKWR